MQVWTILSFAPPPCLLMIGREVRNLHIRPCHSHAGRLKSAPHSSASIAGADEEEDGDNQGTEHRPIIQYDYDDDDHYHKYHSVATGKCALCNFSRMQRNHNIRDNACTALSDLVDDSPDECVISAPVRSLEPVVWDDGETSQPSPSLPVRKSRPSVRWDDDDDEALRPISRQVTCVSGQHDRDTWKRDRISHQPKPCGNCRCYMG